MEDPRTTRAKEKYEGKIFTTTDGKERFIINKFNNGSDIEIEFLDSGYKRRVTSNYINKGIRNPFTDSCVIFDTAEHELVGNYYKTNEGCTVRVIKAPSKKEVTVKFIDEFGYETTTTIQNIRNGQVKNPYLRNKFGGYIGEGKYLKKEYESVYSTWHSMLMRANDHNYYNTSIVPEWLCYDLFAEWYITEISKLNPNYKYEMDKDLKYRFYYASTNGMKMYGPQFTSLMPHDLNAALRNIGSIANCKIGYMSHQLDRNENAIALAEKYYSENAISEETYRLILDTYKEK